jgi:hypothetical protein
MKYKREGNGDYLVLVHGAFTDNSMWKDHLAYLTADFQRSLLLICSAGFIITKKA